MTDQPGSGGHPPNQPFQENGEWRSYDDAGRLLRWDAPNNRWVPVVAPVGQGGMYPPPAGFPQAGYPQQQGYPQGAYPQGGYYAGAAPSFASLKTPALWVSIALAVSVLATVFYIYGVTRQIAVINDLQNPDSTNFFQLIQDAEDADDMVEIGSALQALGFIFTAAMFIWWTRRATANVPALGAAQPKFTPGWAIGWWFIPFANLVQPLRVINQAWRASDEGAIRSGNPLAWKAAAVSPILLTWWLVWIAGSVITGGGSSAYDGADQLDSLETAAITVLVGEVVTIAAAVLAFLVVRRLTERHERANLLTQQRG